MMEYLQLIVPAIFIFAMSLAVVNDLLSLRIPNYTPLILVAGFLLITPFTELSLTEFAMHLGAGLLLFIVSLVLFSFGILGGGDGKLLAASALWFGFTPALVGFILYIAAFGGVLSLIFLKFRSGPVPSMLTSQDWVLRLHDDELGIPYGLAIAAGGVLVLSESALLI